jgi:hypothetical protein
LRRDVQLVEVTAKAADQAAKGDRRKRMKAFLLAVVAAIAIAVGGYMLTGELQREADDAFATPAVRL